MKLLWAITVLKRAGAEQSLLNLVPALLKRGFQLEVVAVRPPYDLAPELEALGVRVHLLDAGRNPLRAILGIAKVLRASRPDVLHAHLFWAQFCGALARYAVPKTRGVATYHNLDYDLFPAKSTGARAAKALFGFLMRGFGAHSAVSGAVAAHFESHLNLPRVNVIPNAFDTRKLAPDTALDADELRERYNLPHDDFLLVMPARLVLEKGHRDAIEALAILRARKRRVHLLICGDGPEGDGLQKRIAARALNDCATMLPPLPHAELFPLMRACDAFVLASHVEGFGMAPAEAMSLGVPVIATDIPGAREVATPNSALLVPPRNPPALARAVETLMDDFDARVAFSKHGRAHIVAHFEAERVAEVWARFYRALV